MQLIEKQIVDEGIDEIGHNSSEDLGQDNSLKRGKRRHRVLETGDPHGVLDTRERGGYFLPKRTRATGTEDLTGCLSLLLLPSCLLPTPPRGVINA